MSAPQSLQLDAAVVTELAALSLAHDSHPWAESRWQQLLNMPMIDAWSIQFSGKIAAFLVSQQQLDQAEVLYSLVVGDSRRQGLARRLLTHAMTHYAERGCCELRLEVRASNQSAQNLYKSCGFSQVGCRKNYYPTTTAREDALIFRHSLAIR